MRNMNDKSILFVISQLDIGGAAKMLKYVSNLCTSSFKKVVVVSYYGSDTPAGMNDGIVFFNLNTKISKLPIWRIPAVSRLHQIIKKEDCDIICSFLPDISFMSLLASFRSRARIISAERGDPYEFSFLWRKLMTYTYKKSDYCIFQLEKARDFFPESVRNHSFVIPNPYVPSDNGGYYYGERKKTIVSAGRFASQKRYDILIRAFSIVHATHSDYKLVLFGDGPCLSQYVSLAKELGVIDYVEFPGYVKSVPQAVKDQGIFVLSSDYEGIPNSLIEAMSVGVPTISTDCTPGGPAFLTANGERGLLVPVHDVDAMANAIVFYIENPELANTYGKNGMEIISVLDIDRINNMWLSAFSEVLKS